MKTGLTFGLGALVGALVGAVVALLFAPSSGEELRANIKTQADTQVAKMQDQWQTGMNELKGRMDKMSSDLQELASHNQ
jgi:gas vesicle protein